MQCTPVDGYYTLTYYLITYPIKLLEDFCHSTMRKVMPNLCSHDGPMKINAII